MERGAPACEGVGEHSLSCFMVLPALQLWSECVFFELEVPYAVYPGDYTNV